MKKISLMAFILLGFLIMAPAVHASTITLSTNSYSALPGGEFTATPSADLAWLLNNYNSNAKVGGGFETFCLEYNEHFTAGGTYQASISDRAMNGGVLPAGTGDPVSIGTAFLYSQFAKGVLASYDYNAVASVVRKADAWQLQLAIWWLEDEYVLSTEGIANNTFLKLLADPYAEKANANGAYGVGVLNLTTVTGSLAQDQLVLVPEPGTILLLGSGFVGLALLTRLRKRKV